MSLNIPVAHDFICPWCWVGWLQAEKLKKEYGVSIDWKGYELWPIELEWPDYPPAPEVPANKPPVLSRFDFILVADDITLPSSERPKKMRTFRAHQAVEFAKTKGVQDELVGKLYRAYWQDGIAINELDTLKALAEGLIDDLDDFAKAIEEKRFADQIVGFDDPAYASGVYNVPTFFIGGERWAEQPYKNLSKAVEKALA